MFRTIRMDVHYEKKAFFFSRKKRKNVFQTYINFRSCTSHHGGKAMIQIDTQRFMNKMTKHTDGVWLHLQRQKIRLLNQLINQKRMSSNFFFIKFSAFHDCHIYIIFSFSNKAIVSCYLQIPTPPKESIVTNGICKKPKTMASKFFLF